MKKLFILFLLSLTISSFAQVSVRHHNPHSNGNVSLSITASGSQRFWLFIDDVLQNEQSVRSIQIQNLSNDDYYVRVELDNAPHNCFGQYMNMAHSNNYAISQSNGFYGLTKSKGNHRPELVMPLVKAENHPNAPYGHFGEPEHPHHDPNGQVPPPPASQNMGMNPNDFSQAYNQIKSQSFDNTRLTIAKQIISNNRMTAAQITEICKLFSFENNALEFAKYAYAFCIDTNKYYLVNEAFKYESSKRDLNEYIQKH